MKLGSFQLSHKLGDGLLGPLYAAVDPATQVRMAVRVLSADAAADSRVLTNLQGLARALSELARPEFPSPLVCGQAADGALYAAVPLLASDSLASRLKGTAGGAAAAVDVLRFGQNAAQALAAAHARGITHLALRPSQFLIDDAGREPKLYILGLGMRAALGRPRTLDLRPALWGFTAPEQREPGGPLPDAKADVYALGTLLFGALTGLAPPQVIDEDKVRQALRAPGMPMVAAAMSGLILRALHPTPRERPTMAELAQQLDGLRVAAGPGPAPRAGERLAATAAGPPAAQAVPASSAAPAPPPVYVAATKDAGDPSDPRIGTLLGNFRVMRKLGEGGMGTVYEARHHQIARRAAIKILHPEYAENPEYAERFLNEARSVNIVQHPGLVEIFEFGRQPDGTLYIVMEFLNGQTLYGRMTQRKAEFDAKEVVPIALQLARALAAAHEKGVIHRDLKPENVMLTPDPVNPEVERVKVLDFGIAKVDAAQRRRSDPERNDRDTRSGAFMGTPLYMSPEQHGHAEQVDGKADVFSLGVVLYELLTGRPPYTGNSLSLIQRQPPPVGKLNSAVPPPLQALVARMMAVESVNRPTMAEVAQLLAPLADKRRGDGGLVRVWRVWAAFAGAGVLLALIGLLAWRTLHPRSLAEARERALQVARESLAADATMTRVQAVHALGQSRDYSLRSLVEPMLNDEEPAVVAAAAHALGQLGDPAAQATLQTALKRVRDSDARLEIAAALLQLHSARGAATLHELVERGDEASRLAAALALAEQGDIAGTPALKQYLDRGTAGAGVDGPTAHVLAALARLGDEDARERLSGLLQSALSQPVRVQAAWSLARLGDEAARAQLILLAGRSGPEQVLTARLLASLGEPSAFELLAAVSTDDKKPDAAREFAIEGLGDCARVDAVPALLAIIEERAASPRLRLAASGAVLQLAAGEPAQLAERSLSWARTALGSDAMLDRELAVTVLGDSDGEIAVSELARALKDRDREVRRGAARALGRKSGRAALAALTEALADVDPQVRTASMQSIVQAATTGPKGGDDTALRAAKKRLEELTRSPDEVSRTGASAALLQLGDQSQSARLRAGLSSADPQARRLAIAAIDPASAEGAAIVDVLKDGNEQVRLAAARRLAAAGNAQAVEVLRELSGRSDVVGTQAFAELRRLGREATFAARPSEMASLSVSDRSALVEAAAELPPGEARQILQVASVDSVATVRRRAAELLAALVRKSPGPDVVNLLRVLRRDPSLAVRARASELLQQLPANLLAASTRPGVSSGATAGRDSREATGHDKPSGGSLLLLGDDGVRVQLDRGPAQPLSSKPLAVTAGRHRVSYPGGAQEVQVAAGETVTVRVPVTLVEQLVGDTADAVRSKDYARAQTLLDRARRLLVRSGGKPAAQAELIFQQGRLDEARGQWREAMSSYSRFLKLPEAHQKAESRTLAKAAVARLAPRMGLIQIFTLRDGKCQLTEEYYLAPGEHLISLGGGRSRTVSAQPGVRTPVRQCP